MPKISQLAKKNPHVYDSEGKKLINQVEIPRDDSFALCKIKNSSGKFQREDLLLTSAAAEKFDRIITEYNFRKSFPKDLFRHKRRILFCGPPGTGKTFSAQVLSSVLQIPFVLVNFEAVISSYLGTTARNLRKLFDYIEQIQNSVILFDEFDIVGKSRNTSRTDVGEAHRIVNSCLQMLDDYAGDSIIVGATNYQGTIDAALWRRFDEVIYYGLPDKKLREQIILYYLDKLGMDSTTDCYDLPDLFIEKTAGLSIYDIKMIFEETAKTLLIEDRQLFAMADLTPALDKYISRNELKIKKTD